MPHQRAGSVATRQAPADNFARGTWAGGQQAPGRTTHDTENVTSPGRFETDDRGSLLSLGPSTARLVLQGDALERQRRIDTGGTGESLLDLSPSTRRKYAPPDALEWHLSSAAPPRTAPTKTQ